MTTTKALADQTPVEIDTQLAELSAVTHAALSAFFAASGQLQVEHNKLDRGTWDSKWSAERIARLEKELPGLEAAWEAAREAEAPFHAEFERRGGWTRAFLVITKGTGHVHKSTRCNTCYPTTEFNWLIELADHDEDEIVELAGERACTICYPSAPVDVRNRPTQLFSKDEIAAKAAREERAAAKAAKDAQKIIVEGFEDFGRSSTKEFKTARAVTNQIAAHLSTLCWYGPANFREEERNIPRLRAALAAKGVEYDYDKALAAARKKADRESSQGSKY